MSGESAVRFRPLLFGVNTVSSDWKLMLAMVGAPIAAILMIAYAFFRPAENPDCKAERASHLSWSLEKESAYLSELTGWR
jgi:hypothetical protein